MTLLEAFKAESRRGGLCQAMTLLESLEAEVRGGEIYEAIILLEAFKSAFIRLRPGEELRESRDTDVGRKASLRKYFARIAHRKRAVILRPLSRLL